MPTWLFLVWMLVLPACGPEREEPAPVDYFSWINPITGTCVKLPEGWRQSPEIAAEGETTVGYFTPHFARLLGRYGQITLHYEYLGDTDPPMTLHELVDRFVEYMRYRSRLMTDPRYGRLEGMETARLALRALHQHRDVLMEVRFWTPDGRDFWYAVVESLVDDPAFSEAAAPIVDQLMRSTRLDEEDSPSAPRTAGPPPAETEHNTNHVDLHPANQ